MATATADGSGLAAVDLDALIAASDNLATSLGLLPSPARHSTVPPTAAQAALLDHERSLLTAVLLGSEDQSPRWGLFRRRIGLRFDEPCPASFWSDPDLVLIAAEIDAIFRGQRPVTTINAEALRQSLRCRSSDGCHDGPLQGKHTICSTLRAKEAVQHIRKSWIGTCWNVELTANGTRAGRSLQATHCSPPACGAPQRLCCN